MIYMRNITITTAKSATYLENVGENDQVDRSFPFSVEAQPIAPEHVEVIEEPPIRRFFIIYHRVTIEAFGQNWLHEKRHVTH